MMAGVRLPVMPPVGPMLAKSIKAIPTGDYLYEPKWDGFRCIVFRDGGCAFAGCDRPPEWTEAHHRIPWEDGGETSVENCCLFCDFHHRVVHHDGWDAVLIDGAIHVIPPPWIDSTRRPRRNTQRAALAALTDLTLLGLPEPDPPPAPVRN